MTTSKTFMTTALAIGVVLSLAMAAAPGAFAKGHDQGVADGDSDHSFGEGSNPGGAGVGGQGGVSGGQNDGTRGDIASGNQGDNDVDPTGTPGG